MRVNRPSIKKVPTRRAHRPDQATYRTLRRRPLAGGRRSIFGWLELLLIVLFIAFLAGLARWLFFS